MSKHIPPRFLHQFLLPGSHRAFPHGWATKSQLKWTLPYYNWCQPMFWHSNRKGIRSRSICIKNDRAESQNPLYSNWENWMSYGRQRTRSMGLILLQWLRTELKPSIQMSTGNKINTEDCGISTAFEKGTRQEESQQRNKVLTEGNFLIRTNQYFIPPPLTTSPSKVRPEWMYFLRSI